MNRFFYFILFYWIATSPLAALQLQNLKVEYTICPIGIDISKPRFSWQMFANAGERNIKQKAYRLRVYNPDNICIWDSGKTNDDRSINIRYQGKNLQPATQYHWQVDVWANHGKPISARSWFETGLTMQQDSYNGWEKAQWIGGGKDDMVLYSHYLPVFRLNYAFCLDSLSEASQAAFIYGANDERLMDSNKNLFGLAARKNESYIKIEINTLPLREGQEAEIRIFRVGFSPEDKKDIPFRTFAIPQTLLNQMNKYQEHMLTIASELGYTRIFFDGNAAAIGEANLNPFGQGGDFTAFAGPVQRGDEILHVALRLSGNAVERAAERACARGGGVAAVGVAVAGGGQGEFRVEVQAGCRIGLRISIDEQCFLFQNR